LTTWNNRPVLTIGGCGPKPIPYHPGSGARVDVIHQPVVLRTARIGTVAISGHKLLPSDFSNAISPATRTAWMVMMMAKPVNHCPDATI